MVCGFASAATSQDPELFWGVNMRKETEKAAVLEETTIVHAISAPSPRTESQTCATSVSNRQLWSCSSQ